jgi:DNA-binding PadR family transcriptional regulator
MTSKLNKKDRQLLAAIAEYRVLTVSQITAIQHKSKQVVRRRLKMMEKAGLILSSTVGFGHSRGRPEKTIFLSENGAALLRSSYDTLRDIPFNRMSVDKIYSLEHQLLTNWFWIHLGQIEQKIPLLSVKFLSPLLPFLKTGPQ